MREGFWTLSICKPTNLTWGIASYECVYICIYTYNWYDIIYIYICTHISMIVFICKVAEEVLGWVMESGDGGLADKYIYMYIYIYIYDPRKTRRQGYAEYVPTTNTLLDPNRNPSYPCPCSPIDPEYVYITYFMIVYVYIHIYIYIYRATPGLCPGVAT